METSLKGEELGLNVLAEFSPQPIKAWGRPTLDKCAECITQRNVYVATGRKVRNAQELIDLLYMEDFKDTKQCSSFSPILFNDQISNQYYQGDHSSIIRPVNPKGKVKLQSDTPNPSQVTPKQTLSVSKNDGGPTDDHD